MQKQRTEAEYETHTHQMQFAVAFDYPVCFTRNALAPDNPALAQAIARLEPTRRHRLTLLLDAGLAEGWPDLEARMRAYVDAHATQLELVGAAVSVPGGEAVKNDPAAPDRVRRVLQARGMDRQSCVVVIGGGAVLDMVGFAAATTHRGVRLIRLPTTVLSQNDGGIGVKNGVNAFGAKNFVGTFAPPFAVICDLDFIETLAERDRIAGIAEAVKVALIRDRAFFERLEADAAALRDGQRDAMARMIRRGAELHAEHIASRGDPFEMGSARPLDYGHWSAHRLETMTGHALRHGEAVAIGMALDARYAYSTGLLSGEALERIIGLLCRLGLPCWHPALDETDALLRGLDEFREHLGGDLTVTLLTGIGSSVEVGELEPERVRAATRWLRLATDGRR